MGWKGVMVEPSPTAFPRLKKLYNGYKGFYLYQVAIGNHNGKDVLHDSGPLCTSEDIGLVSSFSVDEVKRWVHFKGPGVGPVKFEPVEVKMFKWKTFLNRLQVKTFDLFHLTLRGLNFTSFRIWTYQKHHVYVSNTMEARQRKTPIFIVALPNTGYRISFMNQGRTY